MKVVKVTKAQASEIENKHRQLETISLDPQDLIAPLREWETRPTVAAKRIFSMLSILTAAAFVVGVDYSDIPFLGVPQGHGGTALSFIFFLGMLLSGAAYLWNNSIDLKMQEFEFSALRRKSECARSCVDAILETLGSENSYGFPEIRITFDPTDQTRDKPVRFQCTQLDAVLFYDKKIRGHEWKRHIFERLEVYFLTTIALIGIAGLVLYWIRACWV